MDNIWKSKTLQSVKKYFFYPTKDTDADQTKQEISLFKILPFICSDYIEFYYF